MPAPSTVARSRFEAIFEVGRQKYETRTGQRLDATSASNLSTVADLRQYVERHNGEFDAFRKRNQNLYEGLNAALAPVERLGQYVAAGTSISFPPAGACFGAVAFMIKSARDVSAHCDRIMELFEIIGGIMERFELRNLDRTTPQLEENFAKVLATVLEMIGMSTKAIVWKRWKEYLAKVLGGDDDKIEQLRKRLEGLVNDGTSLVVEQIQTSVNQIGDQTAKTHTKVEDIGVATNRIGVDVNSIKDNSHMTMDLLLKQLNTKHENDLIGVLRPTRTIVDIMESMSRERVPEPGAWLLNEPVFHAG